MYPVSQVLRSKVPVFTVHWRRTLIREPCVANREPAKPSDCYSARDGGEPLTYVLDQEQLDAIEEVLEEDFMDMGVRCVFLIDMAGNVIASKDSGKMKHDIYSLAALAAGNFGAVSTMAKIIGEDEFSLLFHKGKKESIHFSKVLKDFLLINIFDQDVSLGFLRLKVSEAINEITGILDHQISP
jgi:predicted regulator of Ras-like GTPase activity (Roadblock/LC7/MglB family)